MTPVHRVDVGISDLQGQSTGLTRELFSRTDSGTPPKSSESAPCLPRAPSYSELARGLCLSLAAQVWVQDLPPGNRVSSGTLRLGFNGESYLPGSW